MEVPELTKRPGDNELSQKFERLEKNFVRMLLQSIKRDKLRKLELLEFPSNINNSTLRSTSQQKL